MKKINKNKKKQKKRSKLQKKMNKNKKIIQKKKNEILDLITIQILIIIDCHKIIKQNFFLKN